MSVKKIYLMGLRLYDSKDAEFPLEYEHVTSVKKQIFLEFLRFDAHEHIAIDLFGDLALLDQIVPILSLVPKTLKVYQSDGLLNDLRLPNIEPVKEKLDTDLSSNPVLTDRPVFLLLEDGVQQVVESSVRGLIARSLESPQNLPEGMVGYLSNFVISSEAERAKLFGNKIPFVCRNPKDTFERRMSEKIPQSALCFLIHLSDFCEG